MIPGNKNQIFSLKMNEKFGMYKILSPNRSFYCMQNKCWLIFEISKDSDYFWVGISFLHNINYHNHHSISVWVVPYDQYTQQLMVFWHYMNICWHLALLSSHTYTHTHIQKHVKRCWFCFCTYSNLYHLSHP